MTEITKLSDDAPNRASLAVDIDGSCVTVAFPAATQDQDMSALEAIHRILLDSFHFV